MPSVDFEQIRRAVESGDYEISLHASERMRRRGISLNDVEEVILHGEIIGREIAYDAGEFMQTEETSCPICGSTLIEKVIDYSDWNDGHLLVVRRVSVRECEANGHRFFHAKVARSLEKVFQADRVGQLQPAEIMQVPVVDLEPVAM